MPMHLAGYIANLDAAGAFVAVAPIPDSMLSINGNNIKIPADMGNIIWAAGGADGVVIPRWRLTSPALIAQGRPEIKPLNVQNAAAVVPDSPPGIFWANDIPIPLVVGENMFAELNNNPAAAQDQWLLVQFANGAPTPLNQVSVHPHRATSATTAVVRTWTNVVIAFDDQLASGTYAVVGLRPMSANMIAARLVFNDDPGHRPGALGGATAQSKTDFRFRNGRLGEWGRFAFDLPPTIDVLCAAADATQEFEIDLVKVA